MTKQKVIIVEQIQISFQSNQKMKLISILSCRNGSEWNVPRIFHTNFWAIPRRIYLSIPLSFSYLCERIVLQSLCIPILHSICFASTEKYTTRSCSRTSSYFSKLIKDFYKHNDNISITAELISALEHLWKPSVKRTFIPLRLYLRTS